MRFKIFGPVVLAAVALLAFAGTASATTLEVKGVKQSGAVTVKASLVPGSSTLWTDTFGSFLNTCTASAFSKTTSVFTGTTVSGPLSTLTFTPCTEEPVVVDTPGTLSVEWISGTTNGTVRSNGTKVTVPTIIDATLPCVTSNTDIGTLTGVASGSARLDINAVLNCTLLTAKWSATYVITGPEGLGVTS